MFEHHFGLRENPFAAGHHARFVFPSPEHQEAIAHLRYGIENREPFVLITGEVGTGKTTALFDALGEWQSRVAVALITNSALTQNELLEEIALRFGVPLSGPTSKPQILVHLERVLAGVYERGDRAILLLDEAQNLERDLLEEIRLLSNLERDGTKLLQVFLVGQPELEGRLARTELRQLRQRITVHYRLQPLSAEDTERYIHHRIMVAGGHAASIFPSKACREVFRLTHGIPREINAVCSQALLNAFVDDARAVAPAHVTSAAAELEFQSVLDGAEVEPREHPAQDVEPLKPRTAGVDRTPEKPRAAEPAVSPQVREGGEGAREDIDIRMIEAWMAELSRSKQGETTGAPTPSPASATARAAAKPAPPAPAALPAPPALREAPAPSPIPAPAAQAAPRKRDLAEEQRAALPPRLRAKLDDGAEEDLESYMPRTRSRGLLILSLVAVALVVAAIMLVRFGVITGLPFMPGTPEHAPAAASAPVAAVPAPADSAAHTTAADSSANSSVADSAAKALAGAPHETAAPGAIGATAAVSSTEKSTTDKSAADKTATDKAAAGKPATAAKPAPASATFGISVATYLDPDRAKAEKVKLAASTGMPVAVQEVSEGGTSVYHLVLGGFDSRTSAEDAATDLIKKGLVEEARIVPGPKVAKR